MKTVILTGGIASGKSTVCKIFEKNGCKIIDADKIAKLTVKKGSVPWHQIVNYFGKDVLKADKEIDRTILGNIIFNNSLSRKKLNKIVHPHVFKKINKLVKKSRAVYPNTIVIVDIPLFFEIFGVKKNSTTLLVYVPEHVQLKRLMKRDGYSQTDALARINSQISIEKKRTHAKIVIDNSGSLEKTEEIVHLVLKKLKIKNNSSKKQTVDHIL